MWVINVQIVKIAVGCCNSFSRDTQDTEVLGMSFARSYSKRRLAPRVEPLLRRSRTLQATVSQLVFDRVKDEAARHGISVSEWVSRAIDRELGAE